MEYIYDAAGNKLAKKLNGTFVNFYCGSMVYTGSKAVEYVMHSQGMARLNGSNWDYQYNVTDHLGNVRSVASGSNAVLQSTDYFPFGLAHGTGNLAKNKYLYNGKELQTELGFNLLDYHARFYDATIGILDQIDPMSEKYAGYSPYAYCGNNPINRIDPNGMDWYIFDDRTKKYKERKNKEGKHRLVVVSFEKNGTEHYKFYDFNDPENDAIAIKNGEISNIDFLSDSKIEGMLEASGVYETNNINNSFPYAFKESLGGHKMDYGVVYKDDIKKNTFYIRENIAYNSGDIGNYLWGRGMAELGIDLLTSLTGAHVNNMLFGRLQETPNYNYGEGTYGSHGIFDSPGDQRAITNGYSNSPKGKARLQIKNNIRKKLPKTHPFIMSNYF